MGRRSRKRMSDGAAGTELAQPESSGAAGNARPNPSARAARDAARAERAAAGEVARPRPTRRGGQRPEAPWGSFPLTELVVLLAMVLLVVGFFVLGLDDARGRIAFGAGLALGTLAGLETAIRDHFAGYRSHSTLLAAAAGVGVMIAINLALRALVPTAAVTLILSITFAIGVLVFGFAFTALRRAFQTRSGGATFR
jgi:hypothetical protein